MAWELEVGFEKQKENIANARQCIWLEGPN